MPETSNFRSSACEAAAAVLDTIVAVKPEFSIASMMEDSVSAEAAASKETSADSLRRATFAVQTPGNAL